AAALGFMLEVLESTEAQVGHQCQQLTPAVLERLTGPPGQTLLHDLYGHARWVAFQLDSELAPARADRPLGPGLVLRQNQVVAQAPPPLERAPSLGLRIACLAGLAPPSPALMAWAARPGEPVAWDATCLDQLWLMLRAADWRAWDFLDVTGLLARFVPE